MSAVGSERIASVVGYQLSVLLQNSTTNLPQRVAAIAEANTLNQSTLDVSAWQATSLKAVGARYGYGSPCYTIARIMLPILGGIPLWFYPQAQAAGATAKQFEITPVGTATGNATHTLIVSGRDGLDAQFFNITINTGDTASNITGKITDAVSAVIGSQVTASDGDYSSIFFTKWKGATANDVTVTMDDNDNPVGITYVHETVASGAGTPSIAAALGLMNPVWNTIGINSYGTNSTIWSALEAWTGKPDPDSPTGRYVGTVMKPIIWLSGSCLDDPSSLTDSHKSEVAVSISPTPLALSLPMEGAASDGATWAVIAQNNPAIDVLNKRLVDIPTPASIGSMEDYNERDRIVKKGCSTVDLVNGNYVMKDPVTTYHPEGELQPAFRWRRDLMVDFNLRYRYKILEELYVVGKVIVNDDDTVENQDVIKPKTWKQILISSFFAPAVADALIVNVDFSAASLVVSIDSSNPNRFDTLFSYEKTGVARISATEAQSGVNIGTIRI